MKGKALFVIFSVLIVAVISFQCHVDPFLTFAVNRKQSQRIADTAQAELLARLSSICRGNPRALRSMVDSLFEGQSLVWVRFIPAHGNTIERGVPIAPEFYEYSYIISNHIDVAFNGRSFGTLSYTKYPDPSSPIKELVTRLRSRIFAAVAPSGLARN